ncbi:MAG: hypothetical protein ACREMU_08735 [Gemmatimonadaceae bacterium]
MSAALGDIPYAIAGGVATREYMPERATTDLDVMIKPQDSARAAEHLRAAGYIARGSLTIGDSAWRAPDGTPVDVIEGHKAWCRHALQEAEAHPNASGTPVLPLHWLVLMKLSASRVQDIADVSRMLGHAPADALARVRDTIRAHAPELAEDLESLIALGQLETRGASD